jgi:hypothetical protein
MILGNAGEDLLLELLLADEETGRFPEVTIYGASGAISEGPLAMADRGGGLYQAEWVSPPAGDYSAVFLTYEDAARTIRTDHEPGLDHVKIETWEAVGAAVADADLSASVTPGSAGLAQVLAHYAGAIHIDTDSGLPGAAYPRGTEEDPVDNLSDALLLADIYGIRRFHIRGNVTLTEAVPDWVFVGDGEEAELRFNGQDVADSEFRSLLVTGTIGTGPVRLERCELDGVSGLEGTALECTFLAGETELAGDFRGLGCYSGVPGTSTPAISIGTGNSLELRGYAGGIEIRNLEDPTSRVSIDMVAGQVRLAASCTAGTVTIRGIGNLTDDSTGATVEREAFVNLPSIADYVLEEPVADHYAAGSVGEALLLAAGHAGLAVRDDALTWDANDRPLGFRRRIFPDSATAAASTPGGTGEGEIATIIVDASHVTAARWESLLRRRTA